MKRWGFAGQGASHGATKSHRSAGATGAHQDPGRIWKGKKMAGRMGGKQITAQSLLVFRVDPVQNLIFVRGSVPGKRGTYVRVKDAVLARTRRFIAEKIPLPTWDPSKPHPPEEEWNAPALEDKDPFNPDNVQSRM
jgi:large subunit ribosomal protein L3